MSNAAHKKPQEQTRQLLLEAAAEEIHLKGFQSASLSEILKRTKVTKGALYHHFPNKHALGYAVVDEVFAMQMRDMWITPLQKTAINPVTFLIELLVFISTDISDEDIKLGCPINNLAQEMSPIDEGFRSRLSGLLSEWRKALCDSLKDGQNNGQVNDDLDCPGAAAFIVASLEGSIGMAKNAQDKEILLQCGSGLIAYLNSIRTHQGDAS